MDNQLSLSTSWLYKSCPSGREIVDKTLDTGLTNIEINFQIRERVFNEICHEVRQKRVCPVTPEMEKVKNFFNYFNLSSSEPDIRKKSVQLTVTTLEHASDLESEAVVFHLGEVEDPSLRAEEKEYRKGIKKESEPLRDHRKFFDQLINERKNCKEKSIGHIRRSLDYLIPVAEKLGIKIGIENRYYISQIPDFDEIGFFLEQYNSEFLGFWYDMGHAANNSNLGYWNYLDYLKEYNDRLIGMHIHDCIGIVDHLTPGDGEIDFKSIMDFSKKKILKILELNAALTDKDVIKGINYLNSIGFICYDDL